LEFDYSESGIVKRSGYRDVGVGAALCAVAAAYLAWTVHWTQPPFEDAAMLLRYAVHVASGHGMVWNVGDAPLDGATDLLFTLAVAGAMHLGVSVEAAARLIGAVAHLVTVFLVYAETRGYHLAACFGLEPRDSFFYYVRPDLPDAERIIDAIRSTRYYYWNRPAIDFARARTGTP
jgi:hypothetical protein